MSLRRLGRFLAATTTTALAVTLAPAVTAQDTIVEFSVSNITDFHGRLEFDDYNKETGAALLTGLSNQINATEIIITTDGGTRVAVPLAEAAAAQPNGSPSPPSAAPASSC